MAKTGKHPGGRPTKYRKTHGARVEQAAESHAPLTDEDIADLLGVSEATVKNWYGRYPEFMASVKKAKAVSDDKVERSLFERATGYSVPDVEIRAVSDGANCGSHIERVPIIKHYPPDVVACIFWLKNRRGAEWRDKQEHEHTGTINVNMVNYADAESIGYNPDGSRKESNA